MAMKNMNYSYKSIWKTSFASSLIRLFLLIYIPLIGVSLYITYNSERVMNERQVTLYNKDLQFTTRKIESLLERYQDIACSIVSDKQTEIINSMPDSPKSLFEMIAVSDKIALLSAPMDLKNRLFLYLPNKSKVITSVPSSIQEAKESDFLLTDSWVIRNVSKEDIIGYTHPLDGGKILTFSYSNLSQNPIICQSVIYDTDLKNFLASSMPKDAQAIYIVDKDDNYIFYSPNPSLESCIESIIFNAKNSSLFQLNDYKILQDLSDLYPIKVGVIYNKHIFNALSTKMYIITAALILFLILFGALCLKFMHRSILYPLYRLYYGMETLSKGNLTAHIREDLQTKDFNFMYTQFNYTVNKINELIEKVNVEHRKYQEAQIKFLHAQINPHFLYNCLNFIYQMSVAGDTDSSAAMSLYLGKYFRYTTKMNTAFVTLEEEINNINTYMNIQKLKLTHRIDYSINIDETILKVEVPKLSLISLVENSIKHGVEPSSSNCDIQIQAYQKDGDIYINIIDTGVGMEQAKLDELNSYIALLKHSDSDINHSFGDGIINPYLRFKFKYGMETDFSIRKNTERGIIVEISFPGKKGDQVC
jgi:two-component system, sensor histidine kinase YesM